MRVYKILAVLSVFILAAALSGCGSSPSAQNPASAATAATTVTAVATKAETTAAMTAAPMSSDEIEKEVFDPAFDLYPCFYGQGVVLTTGSDIGNDYYLVDDDRFTTYEALIKKLKSIFSDDIVNKLIATDGFKDVDGKLYAEEGDCGSDIYFSSVTYSISSQTDTQIVYDAACKYVKDEAYDEYAYDANPPESALRTEHIMYTRELINGSWVFTNFELPW